MAGRKTRKDSEPKEEKAQVDASDTASEETPPAEQATAEATPAETEAKEPETAEDAVEPAPEADDATDEGAEASDETPAEGPDEAPAEAPEQTRVESSEPAPAPVAPVVKRGPGFVPLVLGGVVAAGLGFGASQYLPQYFPLGAAGTETEALKAQLATQAKTIAALQAKLAEVDKATAGMTSQIDSVSNDMGGRIDDAKKTLSAGIETNTLAISDLKTALSQKSAGGSGGALPAGAGAELSALNQKVAALEAQMKARIDAAQQAATAAKAKADAEARKATARAALTRIEAALTAGGPFADSVTALKGAGVEVPPALAGVAEAGVPSVAALRQGFDPAARDALAVSIKTSMGGGVMARITAFLQVQTGARSLTPRTGDGPDAVLSRARAAVEKGDFSAAIETIKALPEAGQKAMAGWVGQADTRLKAVAAAKALASKLNGA